MKKLLFLFVTVLCLLVSCSQPNSEVKVKKSEQGAMLYVAGSPFMINGINWDYIPIGADPTNTDFWQKPDDIIKKGLHREMCLLKEMGVNTLRQYTGVPPRWIQYIYEEYGIYTMINHSFGRYGLMLNNVWQPITDYSHPEMQAVLLAEIEEMVTTYGQTPGILLYLLGNENNYGLFWSGAETEDFPDEQSKKDQIGEEKGRPMYRLMNAAAQKIKSLDRQHPVAICNGDVGFIDIIAEECHDIDIYGTNTYRGISFTDIFDEVKEKLDKPLLLTEFGADAYHSVDKKEDQLAQAKYLVGNWKEIYLNAAGLGQAENTIGGFTFQCTDGWWKYSFDDRILENHHDTIATWTNGGYDHDLAPGAHNMEEEWFGICAKGPTDQDGLYEIYPRTAYYALKEVHQLDPYKKGITPQKIDLYFSNINLKAAEEQALVPIKNIAH